MSAELARTLRVLDLAGKQVGLAHRENLTGLQHLSRALREADSETAALDGKSRMLRALSLSRNTPAAPTVAGIQRNFHYAAWCDRLSEWSESQLKVAAEKRKEIIRLITAQLTELRSVERRGELIRERQELVHRLRRTAAEVFEEENILEQRSASLQNSKQR